MMLLHCHVCGMRFRSMNAEARHRHNFPLLCRQPRKRPRKAGITGDGPDATRSSGASGAASPDLARAVEKPGL